MSQPPRCAKPVTVTPRSGPAYTVPCISEQGHPGECWMGPGSPIGFLGIEDTQPMSIPVEPDEPGEKH